jgi:PBP1b-binding outer membrane lipoprotein LpoB
MKTAKYLVVLIAMAFALNLTACCGSESNVQEKQPQATSQPTVGKQLQDLDTAYKNGAMTKEEYEKLKKDIMDKASK